MFGFLPACAADVETSRLCFAITSLSEEESAIEFAFSTAVCVVRLDLVAGGSSAFAEFVVNRNGLAIATSPKTAPCNDAR